MKKTIAKLIELGFTVSRIKGYEIFTTNYVYISNKDKHVIVSIDDEKQLLTLIRFKDGRAYYYGVFGQYLDGKNDKLFKKALKKVIYDVGQPLNHPNNFIPEEYRGVMEKTIKPLTESRPLAESRPLIDPEMEFFNSLMDMIGAPKKDEQIKCLCKESDKNSHIKPIKRIGGPRKFNLSIFIKNVIAEVFNGDKDAIAFDITEFNTIIFSKYSIDANSMHPYLWRVTINLSSLDDDQIGFISNIDIIDANVNVKDIFNSEYDLFEFINFYKKFKRSCK